MLDYISLAPVVVSEELLELGEANLGQRIEVALDDGLEAPWPVVVTQRWPPFACSKLVHAFPGDDRPCKHERMIDPNCRG